MMKVGLVELPSGFWDDEEVELMIVLTWRA
jgi:hypothetical protein